MSFEDEQERVLTLTNYDDETGLTARVTIAPISVQAVISGDMDVIISGRQLRKTNILFTNGDNMQVHISMSDLTVLERAIGVYFLP